jgi:UDP-N-acetylmuramate--alanine ligase
MFPYNHVHVVGILGSGMNGITNILMEMGLTVTGADGVSSKNLKFFTDKGLDFYSDTDITPLDGCELVVMSSGIKADNIVIAEAKKRGIPVWTRHQLFPELFKSRFVIAVAGSHGKTTTTSIVANLLQKMNVDCGYLIGVPDPKASSKVGTHDVFVIEADEFAKTFLCLQPKIAIINNIDWDHPDIYPSESDYIAAFTQFITQTIAGGGVVIMNGDDKNVQKIYATLSDEQKNLCEVFGKQINSPNHLRSVRFDNLGIRLGLFLERSGYLNNDLFVPFFGEHNAMNSMAALITMQELGISLPMVALKFKDLNTVNRRMELKGETTNHIKLYDDYAHSPAEIKTTLLGLKKAYPNRKVIAIWQPHGYNRIIQYENDFVDACKAADEIIITPMYDPRGDGDYDFVPFKVGLNRFTTYFIDSQDMLLSLLGKLAGVGDIVVMLNAGDLNTMSKLILQALEK